MTRASFIHKLEWSWPVRTVKYLYFRLRFRIKYGYDGYGKPGFTQLFYKGVPMDELEERLFLKKLFGKNEKPVVLEKHNVHHKTNS